jgi:hypothetical protein
MHQAKIKLNLGFKGMQIINYTYYFDDAEIFSKKNVSSAWVTSENKHNKGNSNIYDPVWVERKKWRQEEDISHCELKEHSSLDTEIAWSVGD